MPKPKRYHFAGPFIGPVAIVFGLPLVCYFLVQSCNHQGCLTLYGGISFPGFPVGTCFWRWEAFLVYLGFLVAQAGLHLALPGVKDKGMKLRNGTQLEYKFTGKYNLLLTVLTCYIFGFHRKQLNLAWGYDNFVPLLTASIIISFALSVGLYIASFRQKVLTAEEGESPSSFYNFFMGRELNPRIASLDLKHFAELYPGLIGWVVLDLCMIAKQQQLTGQVSNALLLVTIFHGLYVADAMWMEPKILTTMDITTEGFGYMLVFGNLAWLPFTYCLQARYLVDFPQELSWYKCTGILLLNALGYLIFRASNNQKNLFRKDRNHPWVKQLKTLQTSRGTELIVSGWWGISRHINYFGDWLLAWSWCLPCGFSHIIPYFYVIYFGILLAHRERRDDRACRDKYGKDWDRYCSIVRSRIIPLIY